MRRLLLILITSFCCTSLYSQAVYDSIDFKKIRINGVYMGAKKEEVIRKFGEPHKIVTTEGTKGTDIFSDYHYNKSSLRISPASVFNGFKLTESDLVLRYDQTFSVKVGDTMQEVAQDFPASSKAYQKDPGGKFKLRIKSSNSYIVFKTKDGIIAEIEIKEEIQ